MQIDPNTATRDELVAEVRNTLGINPKDSATEAELREMLMPKQKKTRSVARADEKKTATINIHKVSGPMGRGDVFVSVNNRDYLIKRGVDVEVPVSVLHVLENAVEDVYEYDDEKKDLIKRKVQAYPFTVVR